MHLIIRFRQLALKTFIIGFVSLALFWNQKVKVYAQPKVGLGSYSFATNFWDDLTSDLKLDHHVDDARVQKEIHHLLANKEEFNKTIQASTRYIYFIHQQTKNLNLPGELALIPFIESEYNPNDRSNVGATGIWQLMPATAKGLGVKVKSNYDGRRNIISSTKAALSYFHDLGKLFHGNWYLAIAAYNCGEGAVLSSMHHAGSTHFEDLKLPAETKAYVPRLLAVAEIVKHPSKYGVTLPDLKNQPYFAELTVTKPINLDKLSKVTHIDLPVLNALNPDYKKADTSQASSLIVPADQISEVEKELPESVAS